MQSAELLASVPASTAALLAAARSSGLDATVPTCGGWRTKDLLQHTAGVFTFVTAVLETGGPVPRNGFERPPDGEELYEHVSARAADVVHAIEAVGPDGVAWNWAGQPPTGAFWHRRMAHEAAMHAVDAQLAAGGTPAMDPELAADGIDEVLTVLLPRIAGRDGGAYETIGTLHVHCTDVEGEWLIEPRADGFDVRREHAKGDAALRGPALDLLLRLYNRADTGEVIGDAGVLDRWSQLVRF